MTNWLIGLDTSGKIKVLLTAKDKTQADLATLLEVTRETINNRIEANRWHVEDLKKISEAYGIEITDLI